MERLFHLSSPYHCSDGSTFFNNTVRVIICISIYILLYPLYIKRLSLTLAAAVLEALQVDGLLEEGEVAEDVLVGHLDAERALGADAAYGVLNVHRANVSQPPRQDVHRDERTCEAIKERDIE